MSSRKCLAPFLLVALVATSLLIIPTSAVARAEAPPTLSTSALQQAVEVEARQSASVRALYRALATAAGVDVSFAPKFLDMELEWSGAAQTFLGALEELERSTSTFWVATGPSSILVANDTPQMRRTYEPLVVASFPLRHASITDMMTAMRTIYAVKHVTADESRHLLTVRDTADRIELLRELVARHDIRPPKTTMMLELVAIEPRTKQVKAGGNEADVEELRRRLRETLGRSGETLLTADASIVGQGDAGVRVQRSPLDDRTWLDLAVDLETRTESGEVLLDLRIESSILRRDGENSHAATRGTWRSNDGAPVLVQLPLHLDREGQRKTLALRVTPKVTDAGEPATAKAQWVGTESALRAPDAAP
ncbi:MAG: hypothetical protein MPN21_23950 [Thermoanaerobaculia bacterium]|nr:hypothetical protein [Thermoanaerobaculia bacterium]